MVLDRIPHELHLEVNEDGAAHRHPGYVMRKCPKCGRESPIAKDGREYSTCGRPECEK